MYFVGGKKSNGKAPPHVIIYDRSTENDRPTELHERLHPVYIYIE